MVERGPQKATDLLFDNEIPKVIAPTRATPMEQLELDDNEDSSPTIRHSHRGQGVRTFNFLAVYGQLTPLAELAVKLEFLMVSTRCSIAPCVGSFALRV